MYDYNSPLGSLYPFLTGVGRVETPDPARLVESVRHKAAHSVAVKGAFFEANAQRIVDVAAAIADVYRAGGRMLAMGNGGSCCDADHFAVEFLHPVTAGRPALTVINLAADTAMLTAVANDVGYDQVFVRQVIAHARPEDGLIGFSTSGNSSNLLRAFRRAKEMGLTTIGLAGASGGEMLHSADIDCCLCVVTESVHRIQETHVTTYHILWDLVHTLLAADRGDLMAGTTL